MKTLMDMDFTELSAWLEELHEPRFRAEQVWAWLLHGVQPAHMRNIPKALRIQLEARPFGGAIICQSHKSKIDDTIKHLFQMEDGALVEGVLMRYHHGNTLCLSTQVGCRMGCAFCASTLGGLLRNLTVGEMVAMLAAVEREEQPPAGSRAVTNIVLMGSGEPLDNYENVLLFLQRVTAQSGLRISPRNISLSTCGLVPEIERLQADMPQITLCISLHAPTDALRDTLIPMNKRYPIREVLYAANGFAKATGRRIIIEYALIEGVNASQENAELLASLLRGINCHVNLIPLNSVAESTLRGVSRTHAAAFAAWLTQRHVSATVRREMGTDIEGACGQLRRKVLGGALEPPPQEKNEE